MNDPKEWGPVFWKILHSVSERVGANPIKTLQADELQYYQNFLKQLANVLPCKLCLNHYTIYYKKHYNKKLQYSSCFRLSAWGGAMIMN